MLRTVCILLAFRSGTAEPSSDAVPTCAKKGVTYVSDEDAKGTPNAAWLYTPKMCQMACYMNPTCKHFSWKEDSFPGGACQIFMGEDVQAKTDEKSYSGPRACAGEAPVSGASMASAAGNVDNSLKQFEKDVFDFQKSNEVGSQVTSITHQLNQAAQDLDQFGKDLAPKINQASSDLSQKANEFHSQVNRVGQDLTKKVNQAVDDMTKEANQANSDLTQRTQEFNNQAANLEQQLSQFGKDLSQKANQASTGLSSDLSQKAKEFRSQINQLRQDVTQQTNRVAHDLTQKANQASSDLSQKAKEFNSHANQLGQDLTEQANQVGDVMQSAGLKAKEATQEATQMAPSADEVLGSAPGSSGSSGGGDNTMTFGVIGGIAGALALMGGAYYFMSEDGTKKKKSNRLMKRGVQVDGAPMIEVAPEVQVTPPQAFPQQLHNQVRNVMTYNSQQSPRAVPQYFQVPQQTYAPQAYQPAAAYQATPPATYRGVNVY